MPTGKMQNRKSNKDAGKNFKSETAEELSLEDSSANPGDGMTVRDVGKMGSNMVNKLVQAGKEAFKDSRSQT
jgi:hypothetical protein